MITKNEISSLNLSPTKKDFVQIWNELIEVASKITERWDPTSTNESDPGIVLLKVLTGIADKLNYNIDKNILEAYMPTAAQMESMRKLCELVGYDIKYYQSAETTVRISYVGNTSDKDDEEYLPEAGLAIPKFTTITNADKDITFVTTNTVPMFITNEAPWTTVPCIEGQISQCESLNEHNLITLNQLDDEYRYYLPEIQIAENGIFVYNAAIKNGEYYDGTPWKQVSNLNISSAETRVFRFGYDSFEGRPYLAFPDDVGSLMGDGLFIYFVRTSGLNGNISPRKLEVLEIPSGKDWENYSAELFEVVNAEATTNGANIENISSAYNNFKKTVGTFDTLVTCRDYMNKIYSLMDASNLPYVSNILVTDIRNDINNAITLCSCNEFGILYKETPLAKTIAAPTLYRDVQPTDEAEVYKLVISQDKDRTADVPLIDHFDLLLYPFKTFTQVSSGTKELVPPYNKSFMYTEQVNREIEASLEDLKTCAHNFTTPAEGAIVSINNYLRLNALIATSNRVSEIEANDILKNVKVALVNEFNLRNLDFGEEIPFDSILAVIENADPRIKVVSLQEPTVLTTYSVKENVDGSFTSKEYGIASKEEDKIVGVNYTDDKTEADAVTVKGETARDIYNKLVLRNILAGRASLFKYDEAFVSNNSEKPYTITKKLDLNDTSLDETKKNAINAEVEKYTTKGEYVLPVKGFEEDSTITLRVLSEGQKEVYETFVPALGENGVIKNNTIDNITRVEAVCEIKGSDEGLFNNIKLAKNEVIKFRAPNLITTKTFPAYVYYRFERDGVNAIHEDGTADGSYAAVVSLTSFINSIGVKAFFTGLWERAAAKNSLETFEFKKGNNTIDQSSQLVDVFNSAIAVGTNTEIWTKESDFRNYLATLNTEMTFKYYPLNTNTMSVWSTFIRDRYLEKTGAALPDGTTLWRLSSTSSYTKGKLVTEAGQRLYAQSGDFLANINVGDTTYICTSHGEDPVFSSVTENSDIELKSGDRLYIHYTPSSTNEDGETVNADPISVVYEGGNAEEPVIIKPSGFTLVPSDDINTQGTSWKKTDVDFGKYGKKNLLALAPNEQIEIRSVSRVVLNAPSRFYKNFDNVELERGNINKTISYELKDGEYLFYTDQSTQEAAYYGSGSVITLAPGAYIPRASETVEVSQILEQGLHVVPWSNSILLNSERTITVTEYQYVTLVEGDILNTLTIEEVGTPLSSASWLKCNPKNLITYTPAGADSPTQLPKIALSSGPSTTWEVCSFLELSTSPGYAQQLQAVNAGDEVKGVGVTTASKINKIKVYVDKGTQEELAAEIAPKTSIAPDGTERFEPISIKLNTVVQTASGNFEKPKEDTTKTATKPTSIQMKVFKEEAPKILELDDISDTITPISNKHFVSINPSAAIINNYWTKIDIGSELNQSAVQAGQLEHRPRALKLNFMIPKDADVFGIFSIYLETNENTLDKNSIHNIPKDQARVFIDIPDEFIGESESYTDVISIFNYNRIVDGQNYSWWAETQQVTSADTRNSTDTTIAVIPDNSHRLYLRAGLNCIRVNKSCSLLIKAQEQAAGHILYDNMRLVHGKATNGVNLELLDPGAAFNKTSELIKESGTAEVKQAFEETKKALANDILEKIADLDKYHAFYYNVPIENSLAIEFDNNISSFSNPYTLYDINNVNNSFVISKLDIAYLEDGLRIAKSSKY